MKMQVYESQFVDIMQRHRPSEFTYEGLCYLFEWFEQYEQDTGTAIDLDPVAISCEFIEYTDVDDFIASYSYDLDIEEEATLDEKREEVREYLEDNTAVVALDFARDADDRDTILFAHF